MSTSWRLLLCFDVVWTIALVWWAVWLVRKLLARERIQRRLDEVARRHAAARRALRDLEDRS